MARNIRSGAAQGNRREPSLSDPAGLLERVHEKVPCLLALLAPSRCDGYSKVVMSNSQPDDPRPASVLCAYGFRPFFLSAGLYATLTIFWWLGAFHGHWNLPVRWPPMWWHGHEMIFGFAVAAISGFLLTAVPSWTDTTRIHGRPLCLLVCTWLLGRVALMLPTVLPAPLVALADLIHVPVLIGFVSVPIFRARKLHNMGFPVLLLLLVFGNLLFHAQIMHPTTQTARLGLYLALYAIIVMLTVIGGRVVPAFTRNALRQRGDAAEVNTNPLIAIAALAAMLVAMCLDLLSISDATPSPDLRTATGMAAALSCFLLLWRNRGWQFRRTLGQPILWILHVGQFWVALGFGLKACSAFWPVIPASNAFHAFSAGAIGTMALALMTRASLGHTGRAIHARPAIVVAYLFAIFGAAIRVLGPLLGVSLYTPAIITGGVLWACGYAIYTIVFWPILTRPRVDGRPG